MVARSIHDANPEGQFVPIDCGSLVGTLMESELFGHVRGAFSGAAGDKKGLVEMADGGTAFFDEIGDLPLEMQVKLLRLHPGIGIPCQWARCNGARWTSASSPPPTVTFSAEVAAGRFRLDLYYRLNVFSMQLPPLRQRKEDIPLLVDHFLDLAAATGLPSMESEQEILEPVPGLRLAGKRARIEALHRSAEHHAFRGRAPDGGPAERPAVPVLGFRHFAPIGRGGRKRTTHPPAVLYGSFAGAGDLAAAE